VFGSEIILAIPHASKSDIFYRGIHLVARRRVTHHYRRGEVQWLRFEDSMEERKMAEPTYDELKARLAEMEKSAGQRTGELAFKVGEKGGVSVYGLGRFPVTLYYEQWNRLLEATPRLREFLEENKSRLKLKEK
jgi:hypothetical protein